MTAVTEWEPLELTFESTETVAITELLTGDPAHRRERNAVIEAIMRSGLANSGVIDPNKVRPLIPTWVGPRVVSAVYGGLERRGKLAFVRWGENDDRKGRNGGKPQRIYRWVTS